MLEVKIPSPPIIKMKALIASNNRNTGAVIREYMAILANSIGFIGKAEFSYKDGRVSDDGIFASVEPQQLPLYENVANLFSNIGFEQAMITQIATGNKHYGQDCPIANKNNLRQPIHTWSGRWITIYLWTMLRADFSMRFLGSPKQFVDNKLLMDSLIEQLSLHSNETFGAETVAQPVPPNEPQSSEVSAKQRQTNTVEDNQNEGAQAQQTPESTPNKPAPERTVIDGFDATRASTVVADCLDMDALYALIRKSNNQAVELHCMAQGMDMAQIIAERENIRRDTAKSILKTFGDLLVTVNQNPDFFNDPDRFKVMPKEAPKPIPIDESDPL